MNNREIYSKCVNKYNKPYSNDDDVVLPSSVSIISFFVNHFHSYCFPGVELRRHYWIEKAKSYHYDRN